jgi:hypothetical protein
MPLEEVPGWALDKTLTKAVMQASLGSSGSPALSEGTRTEALESSEQKRDYRLVAAAAGDHPDAITDDTEQVVDAHVVGVKVVVDKDLEAYNRYLAELNRSDVPKRW